MSLSLKQLKAQYPIPITRAPRRELCRGQNQSNEINRKTQYPESKAISLSTTTHYQQPHCRGARSKKKSNNTKSIPKTKTKIKTQDPNHSINHNHPLTASSLLRSPHQKKNKSLNGGRKSKQEQENQSLSPSTRWKEKSLKKQIAE